ncbi:MAG: hypothetical protein JO364_08260 [Pseudonocardiales bacterium]|nr:hypothetical protein [Pseudonocardiales bacterium]
MISFDWIVGILLGYHIWREAETSEAGSWHWYSGGATTHQPSLPDLVTRRRNSAFAQLLFAWINERDNMNTATNPNSRWLFPGRRARQPMHPTTLAALVHNLGVPTRTARTAAIRQHLLDMPAAVVADALSYHPVTTAKITTQIGVTWSRYAPGNHTRSGDS